MAVFHNLVYEKQLCIRLSILIYMITVDKRHMGFVKNYGMEMLRSMECPEAKSVTLIIHWPPFALSGMVRDWW